MNKILVLIEKNKEWMYKLIENVVQTINKQMEYGMKNEDGGYDISLCDRMDSSWP